MSSIKLKHSGGNSVSLNPPNAAPNPAGGGTELALKLPSTYGSNGEALLGDGAGNLSFGNITPTNIAQSQLATGVGGKVIQCAYKQWNTVTSSTSTTGEEIDSSLRITFTPIKNDSLIVFDGRIYVGCSSNVVSVLQLKKSDYTDMSNPTTVYSWRTDITTSYNPANTQIYNGSGTMISANLRVMETSGSTNARTYTPWWMANAGTIWNNSYNAEGNYVGTSTILIQEIVL
tara:strand:- start:989 stop:1681 length:693 start_codon:yes stop_codon:yes gene_type:complete